MTTTKELHFYTMYRPYRDPGLGDFGPSETQQCFKDECDVNNILKKFAMTGELPNAMQNGQYADVSEIADYQSALNMIIDANAAFQSLDKKILDKFNNDPQKFVEFCINPENADEVVNLGLAIPREESKQETAKEQKNAETNPPTNPK